MKKIKKQVILQNWHWKIGEKKNMSENLEDENSKITLKSSNKFDA